jgi:hypothetical protein
VIQLIGASCIGIFNLIHFSCATALTSVSQQFIAPCGYIATPFFWMWSPSIIGVDTANIQVIIEVAMILVAFCIVPVFALMDGINKKK